MLPKNGIASFASVFVIVAEANRILLPLEKISGSESRFTSVKGGRAEAKCAPWRSWFVFCVVFTASLNPIDCAIDPDVTS